MEDHLIEAILTSNHFQPSYNENLNKSNCIDLPYICGICGRKFSDTKDLNHHDILVHSRLCWCSKCNRQFGSINGLKIHNGLCHK